MQADLCADDECDRIYVVVNTGHAPRLYKIDYRESCR